MINRLLISTSEEEITLQFVIHTLEQGQKCYYEFQLVTEYDLPRLKGRYAFLKRRGLNG